MTDLSHQDQIADARVFRPSDLARRRGVSVEHLHECFSLDREAGTLTWRERPASHFKTTRAWRTWNARYSGKPALAAVNGGGYCVGNLDARLLRRNRVIFAMTHGIWPDQVDHKNGVRSDDRPNNLRAADNSTNHQNVGRRTDNTSGFKGVSLDAGRYRATIHANGRKHYVGVFADAKTAAHAYDAAAKKLHGSFAHLNFPEDEHG
jgi:hypothetical protein